VAPGLDPGATRRLARYYGPPRAARRPHPAAPGGVLPPHAAR
jgi:hypothetical protein